MPIAATITIKKPGAMTDKGRKEIAAWMRTQAAHFRKHGYGYATKTNFQARYHFAPR
jgi:hypothetical protein